MARAALTGAVRLDAARIGGRLSAGGVAITAAPDAVSGKGVVIARGLDVSGARIIGTVWLTGADIGNDVEAEAAEIEGATTAVGADVIRVGGNWNMSRARLVGEVTIPGADIAGQLRLTEARLYGTDVALRGDGARIGGGCFLSRALIFGCVRLPAAHIGNQLRLHGASIKVDAGAALVASGSDFARDVEVGKGFQSIGAVVLDQCQIRGDLDLRGSRLQSVAASNNASRKPAQSEDSVFDNHCLSLVDARVGRLRMPVSAADRPRGITDLSRAHVGSFEDHAAAWPQPHSPLRADRAARRKRFGVGATVNIAAGR